MKVALVTQFPDCPSAPRGGVEAVSAALAHSLSKHHDVELHVVTTRRDFRTTSRVANGEVVVHRLRWAGGSSLTHAVGRGRAQIKNYLRELRPDVVHAHDTYGLMVKGIELPRVFTPHGFIYADTKRQRGLVARVRSVLWQIAEESGWAEQPNVISISSYVTANLRGIVRGELFEIDNPVDERFFQVSRSRQTGDRQVILSCAHISPLKNTRALVTAFALLGKRNSKAELRLAGEVLDEAYYGDIKRLIRNEGLEGRVLFLGRINSDAIREQLAQASVFALVSLQENAPMSVAEAMAAGVPVVATNGFGIPYMLENGRSGLLTNPKDDQHIARCLAQLLDDGQTARRLAAEAQVIARGRFHPDAVATKTVAVYSRVLEKRGATGAPRPPSAARTPRPRAD